ncbi:MAG: NnrS family protein [Wenzhouxiangellaceae bacterium]|nr:NnrS family protein [Wenzhouxiangellaceae bacterium]
MNKSSTVRHLVAPVLFPLAAGYAALSVPASLAVREGLITGLPGLAFPLGHAHEMLFGYALAVVAGFLINRAGPLALAAMVLCWLGARAGWILRPDTLIPAGLNIAFAAIVAGIAAPRFMRGAKKWRNRLTGPIVLAIGAAAVLFHLAGWPQFGGLRYLLLQQAVVLFALLMLFFGARLIAPAAAGAIEQAGGHLEARVQPRLEGTVLVLMIAALVLGFMPGASVFTGSLLAAAGVVAAVRLARWRLWRCASRIDLVCLGIGYGWLAAGLMLVGLDQTLGGPYRNPAYTHAITIGALGTLSTCIMLRTRRLQARRQGWRGGSFAWMTALIGVATLLRMLAGGNPTVLAAAGAAWSLALVVLIGALLRGPARDRAERTSGLPG